MHRRKINYTTTTNFFRLFPIRGRLSAKVFSIRNGQLFLPPLLQPSPCLLSSNSSIFSLAFLSFFHQVLPSLSFFSQRNLLSSSRAYTNATNLLSSSRAYTNATSCSEVCLPALQFLPPSRILVLCFILSWTTQCPSHHF